MPAARHAAACASSSSESSSGESSRSSPSAELISQSANHEFAGRSGPWRYVPMTVPARQPSYPELPSFP